MATIPVVSRRRTDETARVHHALGGTAWPLAVFAQHSDRVRRVGIVMPYAKGDAENEARILAFKQELGKLGWTEGLNLQFDEHWTTDNMDLVRAQAASLMASDPDVVVASAGRVIRILMQLSRSIPIVITGASDPVGVGYAKSLAHPGGMSPDLRCSSSRCLPSHSKY